MKKFKSLLFLVILTLSNQTFSQGCIDSSLVNPEIFCAEIYDPVCGCDQVTYANACSATNYFGVSSYTPGECGSNSSCDASFLSYADSTCGFFFEASGASSYEWYFGDGNPGSTGQSVSYTYSEEGTYTVCIYAYDGQEELCDTICQEVYALGCGSAAIDRAVANPILIVYPNPSINGVFSIDYDGEIGNIQLLDLAGRVVAAKINKEQKIIDASFTGPGKYFLKIQLADLLLYEQVMVLK